MKNAFTVLIILLVFAAIGVYVKVNVLDITGAVSAGMTGSVQQPTQQVTSLKSGSLFVVWAFLVLSVTIFFFLRIVRLGA